MVSQSSPQWSLTLGFFSVSSSYSTSSSPPPPHRSLSAVHLSLFRLAVDIRMPSAVECPSCHKRFVRLGSHLSFNPTCGRIVDSTGGSNRNNRVHSEHVANCRGYPSVLDGQPPIHGLGTTNNDMSDAGAHVPFSEEHYASDVDGDQLIPEVDTNGSAGAVQPGDPAEIQMLDANSSVDLDPGEEEDDGEDDNLGGSEDPVIVPDPRESPEARKTYMDHHQELLDAILIDEYVRDDASGLLQWEDHPMGEDDNSGDGNQAFFSSVVDATMLKASAVQDQGSPLEEGNSDVRQWLTSDEEEPASGNALPRRSLYNKEPDNIEVSRYDHELLNDRVYFHFRLALAKLVNDLKPRPPRNFIDRLLELLRYYVGQENGADMTQKHVKNDTFMKEVREVAGRTAKPDLTLVSLESGSYETMDQYDHRNHYRDTATVVTWNAYDQVRSLFGNSRIFGRLENLVVNQTGIDFDPFAKFNPPDGKLSEVMTGKWYQRTHAAMIRRHQEREDIEGLKHPPFLVPVIFGMDATGVDANNRYKIEPLMISFAIIAEDMRNQTGLSHRPLGLMPPLDHKSKNARAREKLGDKVATLVKYGLNTRNYHRLLRRILLSFLDLQEHGLVLNLRFGEYEKVVHCYFPLALWLGDIKSQDMLSGRVMSHFKGCPRLCWQCTCAFNEMDDEKAHCESFDASEYKTMVEHCEEITVYDPDTNRFYGGHSNQTQCEAFARHHRDGALGLEIGESIDESPWRAEPIMCVDRFEKYIENLKSKSCYRVDSILNLIDYGDSDRGQFGALAIDVLHALLGGIIKQTISCFIRGLPSATKEIFEKVADRIFLGQRSCEDRYFPRTNFTHGCTNLTELTCREWAGLMVVVLVVCRSYSGHAILDQLAHRTNSGLAKSQVSESTEVEDGVSDYGSDDEPQKDTSVAEPVAAEDFVHVAELMLSFYGYMNRRKFWERDNERSAQYFQQSCDILLATLKAKCPRTKGNGWKLAKLHAMLKRSKEHIQEFGSPRHSNCEVVERMLQTVAKAPAGNTNRQSYLAVTKTTAMNLDESFLLNEIDSILYRSSPHPTDEHGEVVFSGHFESVESPTSSWQVVPRPPEWTSPDAICCLSENPAYEVGYLPRGDGVVFGGRWQKTRSASHMEVPAMVINQLWSLLFQRLPIASAPIISCFTEVMLRTGKRVRCHPNYRGRGQRFDWVLLKKDPYKGVNCMFRSYEGAENIPVPSFWKHVTSLDNNGVELFWDDEEGSPVKPPTVTELLRRSEGRLGLVFPKGANGPPKKLDCYHDIAWKPLGTSVKMLLGHKSARKKDMEEEPWDIARLEDVPDHMYVADLPQPSMANCKTEVQRRFNEGVVPAKVLCLFRDSQSGRAKALVHPCCHRTMENQIQSSSLVDNWSLQYSYETTLSDVVIAQTAVVDVADGIIDRIAAKQEFPGYNERLDPCDWKEPATAYGLKAPKGKKNKKEQGLISYNHPRNKVNRRRATDAHRNVLVITAMEYWGYEFTTEACSIAEQQRVKRKKRRR